VNAWELRKLAHDGAKRARKLPYARARWRRMRARQLREHPACAECGAPATLVHHVRHVADGGAMHPDESGLQSLCKPCHGREHAGDKRPRKPRRCAPSWEDAVAAWHVFDAANHARAKAGG